MLNKSPLGIRLRLHWGFSFSSYISHRMSWTVSQIKSHVNQTPDNVAIHLDGVKWSYRELWSRSNQLAGFLHDLNAKNQAIGIYTNNTLDMYAALLASWISGNYFIPLNHKFPADRLMQMIAESQLVAIFCEKSSSSEIEKWELNIPILTYCTITPRAASETNQDFSDAQAYTLFTSGSTGKPKGIPINHSHLHALMQDLIDRYPLSKDDKVLQAFEISFDVSIACILLAWTQGAQLVVANLNGITAINAFKAIHDHHINFVTLPPSALHYLKRLRMLEMPLPWVKKTIFTGEALSFNVAKEWQQCAMHTSVDNAYGPTEGTVWSLIYSLDESTASQTINGLCPIGQPLKNILMRIVDEEGREVRPGERGELWIGGSQIFHGYVQLPEKTKEVLFVTADNQYWYKTGDIVLQNSENQVVYINRKDNQVQVNGFRVELGEIEHHLRSIISSESAVVIAHESQGVTELFAFIQGDWNQDIVLNRIREKVPGYMVPRKLFILDHLPINTSGKIDKLLLKEKYIIS